MSTLTLEQQEAWVAEKQRLFQPQAPAPKWETPAHREVDPFDEDYDEIMAQAQSQPSRFRGIAQRSAARGGSRILPIAVGGKNPLVEWKQTVLNSATKQEWEKIAQQNIDELAERFPDANACVVAKPEELIFIDCDSMQEFRAGYEAYTGEQFPVTFTTSARDNRCQIHFEQTDKTRAMGNVHQFAVDGVDLSVRQNNLYVLAEGSVHPTGAVYKAIVDAPIAPMPDKMVDFIQSLEKKAYTGTTRPSGGSQDTEWIPIDITVEGAPIPRGQHDITLFKIASSLRQRDWDRQEALEHLFAVCQARCVNHGTDYRDMCEKKISSAWKYEVKPPAPPVVFSGYDKHQNPQQQAQPQVGRVLQFVRGDSIKPKRLQWLWNNRILADKLNVFSGEPDVGKGMTTVDFAARITRHCDFPDCKNELDGPRDVLFLSSEDDMEDTIIPRLKVAGADMTRIHFAEISDNSSGTLTEGIVCLDRDLPVLEQMIKQHPDIVLIIPDPVIAFLGDADPNKDKDVRPIYSKMKSFAKRLNVAWLFVNHWNKNQNASSINRTSGAKTMVSAPRATWMFSKSPEDPSRYLMMKGKGNLSSLNGAKTLAYRIIGEPYDFGDGKPPGEVPRLIWDGETEHATEDVLQEQADPKSRRNTKAEELLTRLLESGAVLARTVYRESDREHLSADQMKRARYKLGYAARQIGGQWHWAKSEADLTIQEGKIFAPDIDFKAVNTQIAPPTVN